MKMMTHEIVGCDVSKHNLDVALWGGEATARFGNDAQGFKLLIAWLRRQGAAIIGLEPSGGYERGAIKALIDAGFDVRFADARRVRLLADAHNAAAKTDAIDAAFIARFIAETGGRKIVRDPAREKLRQLMAARRALVDAATRLQLQAAMLDDASARRALDAEVRQLAHRAKALAAAALVHLRAQPALARAATLLQTAPGVGPIVAASLLADMPELGTLTGKQAARLAGLAPYVRESGKWKGRAACGGGRVGPRNLLYLAAMTAKRTNPAARAAFDRLVAAGKPKMVALVALMRKLITALNAILRDQKPWTPIANK
jgi:transposase